jgi:hypothetical protein
VRIVHDGDAFELLCDLDGMDVPFAPAHAGRPIASVLCSISTDLPPGLDSAVPFCEWRHDHATLRARGVVASVRHLAPRRYAVTAHVWPNEGLGPLLAAVSAAIRRRDVV